MDNNNNSARYLGMFDNISNKSTIFYPFLRNAQCQSPSSSSSLSSPPPLSLSSSTTSVVPARQFSMANAGNYNHFFHFFKILK